MITQLDGERLTAFVEPFAPKRIRLRPIPWPFGPSPYVSPNKCVPRLHEFTSSSYNRSSFPYHSSARHYPLFPALSSRSRSSAQVNTVIIFACAF